MLDVFLYRSTLESLDAEDRALLRSNLSASIEAGARAGVEGSIHPPAFPSMPWLQSAKPRGLGQRTNSLTILQPHPPVCHLAISLGLGRMG